MSVTETDLLRLSRRVKSIEELPGILGEMSLSEVGAITLWPLNSPPQSWLLCDGAAVSRTAYAGLFGKIGTVYGAGDGSATFNLPNLKGRVPVGRDAGRGEFDTLGETWGGIANTSAQQFFVLNFIIRYQPYSAPKKGDKGDKGDRGEQGTEAPQLAVQYSADGQNWHTIYVQNDNYLRLSTDGGNLWGNAVYIRGEQGQQGIRGEQGVPGAGVPAGGSTGQVLSKRTDTDHDTQWADAAPVVAPAVDNLNDASENSTISIWEGTQAEYDLLETYRDDTLYVINDDQTTPAVPFSLDTMPVGFSMPWWSDTLPSSKWLFMEGQSLVGFTYAQAVFGNALPDLRGRVMVHKSTDTEFNTIKKTGGHKKMQQHTHTQDAHSHTTHWTSNNIYYTSGGLNDIFVRSSGGASNAGDWTSTSATPSIRNAGTGDSENLQPYIVCKYIAKVLP